MGFYFCFRFKHKNGILNNSDSVRHVKLIYFAFPCKYMSLQVLLDLARVIFEEQNNVANLIHKIMMHTMSLLQCERCQVMLIDEKSKVRQYFKV